MVIWAAPAKSDLRAVHDFIASDSKYYATKVVRDIVAKTNILGEYPRLYTASKVNSHTPSFPRKRESRNDA